MPKTLPQRLYKYRALDEFTPRIFTHNEIKFSSPAEFNDPFDCRYHAYFRGSEQERQEYCIFVSKETNPQFSMLERAHDVSVLMSGFTGPNGEQHASINMQTMFEDSLARLGVFSLSKKRDDILMWSHYADSHRGICIEFSELPSQPRPVQYRSEFPSVNILELYRGDIPGAAQHLALTKSPQWAYEEEWRTISRRRGVHQDAQIRISGVVLGCQISKENETLVRSWINERHEEIEVSRAIRHQRQFELEIEPA